MYRGDFALGESIDLKFTTVKNTGLPTSLLGTPAVACYPDNGTTEITAGITLTVDFDSRTGLNHVRIVATAANGYARATEYAVVITAGTVDSISVVGYVAATFSIDRRNGGVAHGTATTGASTTSIPTSSLSPAASVTDQYKGRIVIFEKNTATANLRGQATRITASTSGGTLTVEALSDAPANGELFKIY